MVDYRRVIHEQALPFSNEDLELVFDPKVTLDEILSYLFINETKATIDVHGDLVWEIDGTKYPKMRKFGPATDKALVEVPVGVTITSVVWAESVYEKAKLVTLHDNKTGIPIYPVVHIKGIIGKDGENLSTMIDRMDQNNTQVARHLGIMDEKLLKETIYYKMAHIVNPDADHWDSEAFPSFIGDKYSWGGNDNYKVGLIDADHNVLVSPTNEAWTYEMDKDIEVYFYSDEQIQQTPYEYTFISYRGGGGGSTVDFTPFDGYATFTKQSGEVFNAAGIDEIQRILARVFPETYNATKTYLAGDYVTENGLIYQAIDSSKGKSPFVNPNNWRPLEITDKIIHERYLDDDLKNKLGGSIAVDDVTIEFLNNQLHVKEVSEDLLTLELQLKINNASVAVDDVTIERNANGEVQLKDAGITLDKLAQEVKDEFGGDPDDVTIELNADDKLQIKDAGITLDKLAQEVLDAMGGAPDEVTIEEVNNKLQVKAGNFIKNVKINGTNLTKTNDEVEIPKASASQYGVIKVEVTGETLKITL